MIITIHGGCLMNYSGKHNASEQIDFDDGSNIRLFPPLFFFFFSREALSNPRVPSDLGNCTIGVAWVGGLIHGS